MKDLIGWRAGIPLETEDGNARNSSCQMSGEARHLYGPIRYDDDPNELSRDCLLRRRHKILGWGGGQRHARTANGGAVAEKAERESATGESNGPWTWRLLMAQENGRYEGRLQGQEGSALNLGHH